MRRKQVRTGLSTRAALVDRYVEMHHAPPPAPKTVVAEPAPVEARPRLEVGISMTEQNEGELKALWRPERIGAKPRCAMAVGARGSSVWAQASINIG